METHFLWTKEFVLASASCRVYFIFGYFTSALNVDLLWARKPPSTRSFLGSSREPCPSAGTSLLSREWNANRLIESLITVLDWLPVCYFPLQDSSWCRWALLNGSPFWASLLRHSLPVWEKLRCSVTVTSIPSKCHRSFLSHFFVAGIYSVPFFFLNYSFLITIAISFLSICLFYRRPSRTDEFHASCLCYFFFARENHSVETIVDILSGSVLFFYFLFF